MNYINSIKSSNNMNITQFNHIDTDMKENCNVPTDNNITSNNNNDIIQRKNMFSPNILNINSRYRMILIYYSRILFSENKR